VQLPNACGTGHLNVSAAVHLCVQLWANPGQDSALIDFEDQVLALIPHHGGRVLQRVRRTEPSEEALEVQVISFPNDAAFEAYLADPERLALGNHREIAIARTVITRVQIIE